MHAIERIVAENAEQVSKRFLDAIDGTAWYRAADILAANPDLRAYIEKFRG